MKNVVLVSLIMLLTLVSPVRGDVGNLSGFTDPRGKHLAVMTELEKEDNEMFVFGFVAGEGYFSGIEKIKSYFKGFFGLKKHEKIIYLVAQNPPGMGNARWHVIEGGLDFSALEKPGKSVIRVKRGERVVLRITSIDNVHGFSLPAFDINEHIYPGKITEVSFLAGEVGEYYFTCNIVCGDRDHSKMRGKIVIEG